jgi:predicted RNA-binding protein Jag
MNVSVDDLKEFVAESREAALAMAEGYFRVAADQLETWVVPPSLPVSGLGGRTLLIAALRSERSSSAPEARREERRPAERERPPARERDRGRDRGDREGSHARRAPESPRFPSEERSARPAAHEVPADAEEQVAAPSGRLGQVGTFVAGILERMKLRDVAVSEKEADDGEIIVTVSGRSITTLAERDPRLVAALSHLAHRAAEALIDDDATALVEIRGLRRAPREEGRERSGREGRRDQRRGAPREERGGRGRDPEDRDIDEAELERLARDSARAVRESGEAELLPPMNSRERWFVHNALKDERGVRSESEGDGARKRIKIFPA